MKNILVLFIIVSAQIFSQTEEHSFYSFKQQIVENISSTETSETYVMFDDVKKKKVPDLQFYIL